jgi:hypothetical protein
MIQACPVCYSTDVKTSFDNVGIPGLTSSTEVQLTCGECGFQSISFAEFASMEELEEARESPESADDHTNQMIESVMTQLAIAEGQASDELLDALLHICADVDTPTPKTPDELVAALSSSTGLTEEKVWTRLAYCKVDVAADVVLPREIIKEDKSLILMTFAVAVVVGGFGFLPFSGIMFGLGIVQLALYFSRQKQRNAEYQSMLVAEEE